MFPLRLHSTGVYLPKRSVSYQEIAEKTGVEASWILEKSGVATRYFVEDETIGSMGAYALTDALRRGQLSFQDLDLIICASGSYDHPVPSNACLIPRFMGQPDLGIPCWDIDATCLSFITSLEVVGALIGAGRYKRIAVVASEISSKSLNFKEKESSTLLGDGAAAAIFTHSAAQQTSAMLAYRMETYSSGAYYTYVRGGGNVLHPRNPEATPDDFTFHMEGKEVLKMASSHIKPFFKRFFAELPYSLQDMDMVIPHQASKIGLSMAQKAMELPSERFYNVLGLYGNCIAASVPMALHHAIVENKVQRDQKILLCGTGAGFSIGAALLNY
ncbi:MAG: beta-ketoacyl-ACP synthase III [Cytophagales bacterium]|nr:MAG: beta-ketoacyl-ACP synthase III [Cytophagales bacterium]